MAKRIAKLKGIANLLLHRQKGIKVIHDGIDMGIGFIPDIILENKLIIELKSVESLAEVHFKQLLTYLRLTNIKLGLLINFNVPLIKKWYSQNSK
jgi:GxxExxY protein